MLHMCEWFILCTTGSSMQIFVFQTLLFCHTKYFNETARNSIMLYFQQNNKLT